MTGIAHIIHINNELYGARILFDGQNDPIEYYHRGSKHMVSMAIQQKFPNLRIVGSIDFSHKLQAKCA